MLKNLLIKITPMIHGKEKKPIRLGDYFESRPEATQKTIEKAINLLNERL